MHPRVRFALAFLMAASCASGCRWLGDFRAVSTNPGDGGAEGDGMQAKDGGRAEDAGGSGDAVPGQDGPSAIFPVASDIAAGAGFSCGVFGGGAVHCWGRNEFSQLGNGVPYLDHTLPQAVSYLDENGANGPLLANRVAAGYDHACALTGGEVYCWGANWYQQAGTALEGKDWMLSRARKVPFLPPAGLPVPRLTAIALGVSFSCALADDGVVWCWGGGKSGQLGRGPSLPSIQPPTPIGLASMKAPLPVFSELACGGYHCCALAAPNTLGLPRRIFCWGANWSGQVDPLVATDAGHTPIPHELPDGFFPESVATGGDFSCAIGRMSSASVPALHCWGDPTRGQFACGGTCGDNFTQSLPVPWGSDAAALRLSLGYEHSCLIDSRQQVTCWGANRYGELGYGKVASIGDQDLLPPASLKLPDGSLLRAERVSCGDHHCCAIGAGNGRPWCWGRNLAGALGDGGEDRQHVPGAGPTFANNPATGPPLVAMGPNHGCIVDNPNTAGSKLRCWGANEQSQLGIAASAFESVALESFPRGTAALPLTAIGLGRGQSCAFWPNAGVYCWGGSDYGHRNGAVPAEQALLVGGTQAFSGEVALALGNRHGCALAQGVVSCWGNSSHGELGYGGYDENAAALRADIPTVAGGVKGLAVAACSSCAHDGRAIYCWGCNFDGQLGWGANLGTEKSMASPTALVLPPREVGFEIKKIVRSASHGCALAAKDESGANQGLLCWGANWAGELGLAMTSPSETPGWVTALDAAGATAVDPGSVVDMAIGNNFSCALKRFKRGDTVYCWGSQIAFRFAGQLTEIMALPTEVKGLPTSLMALHAGANQVCAQAADKLYCWGETSLGQLGNEKGAHRTIAAVRFP